MVIDSYDILMLDSQRTSISESHQIVDSRCRAERLERSLGVQGRRSSKYGGRRGRDVEKGNGREPEDGRRTNEE